MIWYGMIYDMIWYDMTWHDMIWYNMIKWNEHFGNGQNKPTEGKEPKRRHTYHSGISQKH